MSELIQDIPRKVKGKFNKDLLLNTYFEHTDLFSPAANKFLTTGKYSGEIFNSKKYNIFWGQEKERCIYGYENPITKIWIPGKYYFFLNYKQMKIIPPDQAGKKSAKRVTAFPRFWPIHYFYLQDWITAKDNGLNMIVLKPRDTGFSELLSSNGVHEYTFQKEDPVFYFVAVERFLNKDGVLSKAWDQINFLNNSTERAFKHLRQYKDQDLYKRASYQDSETGSEKRTGGEIQGAVIDNPRKVRGARGFVNWEEFGSFPNGEDAWMTAKALAEQGGVKFAMQTAWGCVCAGTKVWTHDGRYINVEELQKEDGIIGYNGKGISYEPIIGMNPPAEKPCYRIELENGLHIECSEDHPFLWSNTEFRAHKGKPRRVMSKQAQLIKPGDYLFAADTVSVFGTKTMPHARLVGLLIGDGNYGSNASTSICGCDTGVINFLEQDYNLTASKEHINKSDGRIFKRFQVPGFRPLLRELGIQAQIKQHKRLPDNLHKYTKESIAELLGGYYDADGAIRNDKTRGVSIVLTSISYELLDQVKWQLYKFGVHSTILEENPKGGFGDKKGERHLVYRLYINRYSSIVNFAKNIKLLCTHKQELLQKALTENREITKVLDNATFVFDETNGKGVYFKDKIDLSGAQLYKVLTVTPIGNKPIYNLNAGTTHTYLANNLITFNTGGEQGPGIAAMDQIFNNPSLYDCLEFDACWEDGLEAKTHGFFFPVWANMTKFMDRWGNTDHAKAKAYWDAEREKTRKGSNMLVDKLIAEYPYTPMEALMRLNANPFPVGKLQKQLQLVDSSPEIQGMLKVGEWEVEEGKIQFKLNSKLDPVKKYPHKTDEVLEGAFTMFEAPLKNDDGKVPPNLYYIVADCFAVDTEQATDWNSLGSFYVYKKKNSVFPTEDDILVGWYAGRPPRVKDFHRRVFLAARAYNAVVQTEIKGGGQELLNYAVQKGFTEYCGDRPTVFNQDKEFKRVTGRQFFVRIEENTKPERIQKLVDWLLSERGGKIVNGEAQYVLNLEKIYDRALLEELIKFNPNGNFDRISCLLVLMTIMQEAELQVIEQQNKRTKDHIFERNLFSDSYNRKEFMLTPGEMGVVRNNPTDLIM